MAGVAGGANWREALTSDTILVGGKGPTIFACLAIGPSLEIEDSDFDVLIGLRTSLYICNICAHKRQSCHCLDHISNTYSFRSSWLCLVHPIIACTHRCISVISRPLRSLRAACRRLAHIFAILTRVCVTVCIVVPPLIRLAHHALVRPSRFDLSDPSRLTFQYGRLSPAVPPLSRPPACPPALLPASRPLACPPSCPLARPSALPPALAPSSRPLAAPPAPSPPPRPFLPLPARLGLDMSVKTKKQKQKQDRRAYPFHQLLADRPCNPPLGLAPVALGVASLLNARLESSLSRAPLTTPFAPPSLFEDAHERTLLFFPGSRTPHPTPTQARAAHTLLRDGTPLFLPGSRNPTPYSGPDTPAEARELPPARMEGPDTQPTDVAQFLDLHASDSDDDNNEEAPFIMTQQDLDFIDDDTRYPESVLLLSKHTLEQPEVSDLEELAAHYEKEVSSYTQSAAMELNDAVKLSDVAHDLTQHPGLRPAMEEAISFVMPKPVAPALPPRAEDTAGQMIHQLKQLVPAASSFDVVQNGTWIHFWFQIVATGKPLRQAAYPRIYPTIEEVAPFFVVYDQFTNARFVGPAFCLQAGDRVIVTEGQHTGDHFYILKVRDFLADTTAKDRYIPLEDVPKETAIQANLVIQMARLHVRAQATKENPGFWHPPTQLRHHVLYPSALPQILDRVHITGFHPSMDQGVAWIMSIQDIGDHRQLIKVKRENDQTLDVELDALHRDFHLGDHLLVARGEHKSRKGFVTALLDCGVLELFDGSQPQWSEWAERHPDTNSGVHFGIAHTFQVRSADVDFLLFNANGNDSAMLAVNNFVGQYTVTSEVPHSSIPRPVSDAPNVLLTRRENKAAISAEEDTRITVSSLVGHSLAANFQHLDDEQQARNVQIAKLKQQQDQDKIELLNKVGKRYEDLKVLVVGTKVTKATIEGQKGSVFKGKRGRVIGDFDSDACAVRLRAQDLTLCTNVRGDTRGIMARLVLILRGVRLISASTFVHGDNLPSPRVSSSRPISSTSLPLRTSPTHLLAAFPHLISATATALHASSCFPSNSPVFSLMSSPLLVERLVGTSFLCEDLSSPVSLDFLRRSVSSHLAAALPLSCSFPLSSLLDLSCSTSISMLGLCAIRARAPRVSVPWSGLHLWQAPTLLLPPPPCFSFWLPPSFLNKQPIPPILDGHVSLSSRVADTHVSLLDVRKAAASFLPFKKARKSAKQNVLGSSSFCPAFPPTAASSFGLLLIPTLRTFP
ncbi:hypothetical protein B0H17DRAFT_1223021 [Mycena rosella]|uniref:Uncharacterized protein n=1 Tax=Mycena rosella TaxID=1033263 RepID=A0AAD7AWJ4_MYCRO|nr:hypothetical protein B0H17DRAFT_1223021 [Mycena rosella]